MYRVVVPFEETRRVLYAKIFLFETFEEAKNFREKAINYGIDYEIPDEIEDIDVIDSSFSVIVSDLIEDVEVLKVEAEQV